MPSKSKPLTKAKLAAFEAKRDLAAELLQSVREMKAGQVRWCRRPSSRPARSTGLSQSQFAALLGVSVRTLQGWEQGRKQPSGAARTLLAIASTNPGRCLPWRRSSASCSRRPTLPSSGQATAGFACFRLPLMSNVRPQELPLVCWDDHMVDIDSAEASTFGPGHCPACGSKRIGRSSADPAHESPSHQCTSCGARLVTTLSLRRTLLIGGAGLGVVLYLIWVTSSIRLIESLSNSVRIALLAALIAAAYIACSHFIRSGINYEHWRSRSQ